MIKKGDTLVEVCIAIGIFSLIAIGVASVMSSGTSGTQTALETTLAREEIDAQAEALRFIQSSYIVNRDSDDNAYKALWREITSHAVDPSESVVQYNPSNCLEPYNNGDLTKQNAFVINTRALGSESTLGSSYISFRNAPNKFSQTLTYPRLVFGSSDAADNLISPTASGSLYKAEGIYVVAVRDQKTTNLITERKNASAVSAFYDFYIRTCWYGTDAERPTTISTVIRLYDPDEVSTVAQENVRDQVTVKYNNPSNYPPGVAFPYTTLNIPAGETKNLANPNASSVFSKYHRFLCWGVNSSNCNGGYASGAPYKAPNKGEFNDQNRFINLYAIWNTERFYVTYNANGGAFSGGATTKTEYCAIFSTCELSYTIPTTYFSTPTRSGYRLVGWSTKSNATSPQFTQTSPLVGSLYTTKNASDNESKGKVTLYAVWKPYYYITYNANGGAFSGGATTKTDTCIPLNPCESNYSIPSGYFSGISRSGYSFLGWSTKSNASSPSYTSGSAKYGKLTGNFTLYAVWKPYYYITFNANGGVFSNGATTKTESCAPIASCANSYRIPAGYFSGISRSGGYSFLGWSTNRSATSASYTSSSTAVGKLTGNITLYAVWKSYYYITYDAGQGEFVGGATTKTDSCAPIASCANSYVIPSRYFNQNDSAPTRSGYRFLGWSKNANPTSAQYTSSASIGKLTGNVRLYAAWQQQNETITITASWTSGNDYDSFLKLSTSSGGYVTATWSTTNEVNDPKVVGAGDGRGSYNGRYYEKYTITTLGGKNYYYAITRYDGGWPNSVGGDITVTVSGPYIGTHTFSSSSVSCSAYWNVFVLRNGRIQTPPSGHACTSDQYHMY